MTFQGNSAVVGGGISAYYNSSLQLSNVTFQSNSVTGTGGGMFMALYYQNSTLSHVNFDSNTSSGDSGGASLSSSTLTDVTFNNNSAVTIGGGLSGNSNTLSNVSFTANSAANGGGMYTWGGSSLTNVVFDGNTAASNGGGMYVGSYASGITKTTFMNNSAGENGGGVYNTIRNNSYPFANSTFVSNHAAYGGGMYNYFSNPALNNVTFSANTATFSGGGMANFADASGNPSNPTVKNSIFWGNTTDQIYNDDVSQAAVTYSVVQDSYVGSGNKTGNPLLGTLGKNGGFTSTIPILAGSSAISTGQNSTCATDDQRGAMRPVGSTCDMGAFESGYFISGNTGTGDAVITYTDGYTKTVTADADGNFWFVVSYGWTGSITPSKASFIFQPASISYASAPVTDHLVGQNFTAITAFNISGSLGTSGAGATLSYTDGTLKTVIAGSDGAYSLAVSNNWSGTVTPSKAGYSFSPVNRAYTSVKADKVSQYYNVLVAYIISGNAGVADAVLSYTDGTPKMATADGSGLYSFTVSNNWSGTVTPSKAGYTFSPVDKSYSNIAADQSAQNYTATAITYIISGNAGIGGATLSYTDGTSKTAIADTLGIYSFTVSYNWSGMVTPSKTGYSFSPTSFAYSNVLSNKTAQNYTAVSSAVTFNISGNAGIGGATLSYTDGTSKTATADGSGVNLLTVSNNWSGTVTPSKTGYTFSPVNKSYTNVTADQITQNYTATAILTDHIISGNAGIGGAALSYADGTSKTATADGSGVYSFTVSNNWSGVVTPSKTGYTFSPVNKSYTNVITDQAAQNYTATLIPTAHIISGIAGTGGVTLSYTDGTSKTTTADGSGVYSFTVSNNWSGTVTPSKTGYTFSPVNKSYANVTADQITQNYTALIVITIQPSVASIVRFNPNPTHLASVDFTVTFSEFVTGVDAGDFTLTKTGALNGESIANVSGGPTIYTVTVNTGTGSGTLRVDMPTSATIVNSAMNQMTGLPYTSGESYTIDKTAPTVISSVRNNVNLTNAASINFTVTFSEPMTGLDAGDFVLTKNGSLNGDSVVNVGGGPTVYTVTVNTGAGDGDLRLDLPSSATTVTDLGGNPLQNLPYTNGESYVVDKTAPTVGSSRRVNSNPINVSSVDFTVTFSESVEDVDIGDFTLTKTSMINGEFIMAVSGEAATYTITVNTGTGSGDLRLDLSASATITELAGNPLSGMPYTSGESYTIDKTSPTVVSVVRTNASLSSAASVDFNVTFSESVVGVDAVDFTLIKTGTLSGESVTGVSGGPIIYMVTVNTGTGSGDLRLDVSATAIGADLTGNPLVGLPYLSGESYTIDKTASTLVSIVRASVNLTKSTSVDFTVTFPEPVTGVDADDFGLNKTGSLNGESVTGVSGGPSIYTVTVNTGTGSGSLRLDVIVSATITNLAGNPLAGLPYTSGESYTIDKNAPTVISSVRNNVNPTNAASVGFTVNFSEPMMGVDAGDFALSKTGTLSGEFVASVSGGPSTYTIIVNSGTRSGDLRLDVSASANVTDLAGNLHSGLPYTSGESYTFDKDAPLAVSIIRANLALTNAASVGFTVTFSEPVIGVDAVDFALTKTGTLSNESVTGVSGGPSIYTVTVNTGTGSGDLRLDVSTNAAAADSTGNPLSGQPYISGESYTIDKTAPTVLLIMRTNANLTSAASVDFTVTFSEPVTGVDVGDFALTKTGLLSSESFVGVSGGPTIYTVTINTGIGDGSLRLDVPVSATVADLAVGNSLTGLSYTNGESYTIDKNAPVVISSLRGDADATAAESVRFIVTFSEAVSGVDVGDFILTSAGSLSGGSITNLSGSADIYTITAATGSGNGTLRLDLIDNDSIVDSINQPLGGLGADNGNFTIGDVYTVNKFSGATISASFSSNGANDGWVLESNENSNLGGTKNSIDSNFKLGDDFQDRQFRSILHFQTKQLPDNAVITKAILMIKKQNVVGIDPFTTHQNILVDIHDGFFSNFDLLGLIGYGSLPVKNFQADADMNSVGTIRNNPAAGWYWTMLDNRAFTYISRTGLTQIRLGFQLDDNDDNNDDYIKFYSGDAANLKNRPHLQIEYYVP